MPLPHPTPLALATAILVSAVAGPSMASAQDLTYILALKHSVPVPDVQAEHSHGRPPQHPSVTVEARFTGDADATTDLELQKEWGGNTNDGSDVGDLVVTGKDGRTIPAERIQPWSWRIIHQPSEPLTFRYTIRPTPLRDDLRMGNDYRTRLRDGFFQCTPNLAFLMPSHLSDDKPRHFAISLQGFAAASSNNLAGPSWRVMSSWGDGAERFERHSTAGEFLHAMIFAGDASPNGPHAPAHSRFHTKQIGPNTVGFAIVGASGGSAVEWGFQDQQFIDLASRIVELERDFFRDHSDPWFLITLTPEGGSANGGSFSLGGTGLFNCFSLYCNTGLSLDPGSPYLERIAILLAHEYFHTWNGLKVRTSADDGQGEGGTYWFSEGFTNFFARRILHTAGIIDDLAYATNLSEAVSAYDANPFKNAPNQKIRDEFWKDQSVGQLPYQRGDLIALWLDQRLRTISKGEGSLDDFMRWVCDKHKDDPAVTTDEILALISEALGADVAATVRAWVIDGTSVELPETLTSPALRLTSKAMRTFDRNFDPDASQREGQVVGVIADSEAFKAGLRDGQKLLGFSIKGGSPTEPPSAIVEVEVDGQPKRIEYEAVSNPKPVRAYVQQ